MNKFKFWLVVCWLGVSQSLWANQALNCVRALSLLPNMNAETPAGRYQEPHWRLFNEYGLGPDKEKLRERAKKGATVFDIGGGFGVAAAELAAEGGKTYVINAQDFQSFYLGEQGHLRASGQAVNKMAQAFGFVTPDPRNPRANLITEVLYSKVKNKLQQLKDLDLFHYIVGFAEVELPKLAQKVKADFIIDFWAAFSYSSAKKELLEIYYDSLKIGGEAYVYIDIDQISHRQKVRTASGDLVPMQTWLVETYPEIFSFNGFLLRMKKVGSIVNLKLPLKVETIDTKLTWGPPTVIYEEVPF